MNKHVLASASYYTQKYFINEEFTELPTEIRNEIRVICIALAEKIHGVFTMGFYDNGQVFMESTGEEVDYDYDDIGAQLEMKRLETEKKELLKAMQLWFAVYKTEEGHQLQKEVLKRSQNI